MLSHLELPISEPPWGVHEGAPERRVTIVARARQREVPEDRAELLLTLAYGMNLGLALHQRFSDEPIDEEAAARTLTELIRHGTEGTPPQAS